MFLQHVYQPRFAQATFSGDQYGTTVEEMETASAAQIAGAFEIPFLGVRVVSNNITNGEVYDTKVGKACQDYVRDVVRAYIAARLKR